MKGRRGCATVCGFSLGPVSHISRFETGNSRRIPRVRTPARVRGALVCAKQKRAPVALPYFSIAPRLRQQTLPGHDQCFRSPSRRRALSTWTGPVQGRQNAAASFISIARTTSSSAPGSSECRTRQSFQKTSTSLLRSLTT